VRESRCNDCCSECIEHAIFHALQRRKIHAFIHKKASASGVLRPQRAQTPYLGFAPGPHWGTSVPRPLYFTPQLEILNTPLRIALSEIVLHTYVWPIYNNNKFYLPERNI